MANAHVIPDELIAEIKDELEKLSFGSIEIYVQDKKVTQITVRNIKKTNLISTHTKQQARVNSESQYHIKNNQSKIRVLTIQK